MNLRRAANRIAYGFETFILRRRKPYLLGIVLTDRCNLSCFYCESKNTGRYHLSYDEAAAAIRDGYRRGCRSLYFTGGEPMIWCEEGRTLKDLVRCARELGYFDVFVFTNGTRALDVADCNYIVTVDGPREVHERVRPGTYDTIMSNVRAACTRAVFASITFGKENAGCAEAFVREITATGLFRSVSFNLLTHWPEMVREHGVFGDERAALLDCLWNLRRQGYPVVLSRAAYWALRRNDWKRPIPQIQLYTKERLFTCCRDVDNPSVCENCGYANCVEISQIMALRPSALMQVLRMVS